MMLDIEVHEDELQDLIYSLCDSIKLCYQCGEREAAHRLEVLREKLLKLSPHKNITRSK